MTGHSGGPAALDTVLILWAEAEAPPCSTGAPRPGSQLAGDSEGGHSHLPAPAPGPLSAPPVPGARDTEHCWLSRTRALTARSILAPDPSPLGRPCRCRSVTSPETEAQSGLGSALAEAEVDPLLEPSAPLDTPLGHAQGPDHTHHTQLWKGLSGSGVRGLSNKETSLGSPGRSGLPTSQAESQEPTGPTGLACLLSQGPAPCDCPQDPHSCSGSWKVLRMGSMSTPPGPCCWPAVHVLSPSSAPRNSSSHPGSPPSPLTQQEGGQHNQGTVPVGRQAQGGLVTWGSPRPPWEQGRVPGPPQAVSANTS
uniref:uncharacterized protein LOC120883986 n=1 Tax=Ictidomys tridecemlineatus TaxID=43179 RepID=UPI001A9E8489|nr:uncharacterized protein LOC120883986 [Ictidomys tridecemlineatus]XP_040124295.1 uncharacterized protein LOC120883986 [Ictidomys tridecemlineatus]XP_040124296.1 uncharacterized protein LOC120883986 [Ictidomys tridecemlineatus]XP_040124297.1 uncharacterized protein LOC120883986 [Ictidomys tridecemlineatus]